MITIRKENAEECRVIRQVHLEAFGQSNEANLVDALRERGATTLSLVAIQDSRIVGHILFSPVSIGSVHDAVGLGPMAVLPEYQGKGIGSQLLRVALEKCRQAGHEIVVVLGHPEFYSRFGFSSAKPHGIDCEFDVPADVFMVMELRDGALAGRTGLVRYQPEFRSF